MACLLLAAVPSLALAVLAPNGLASLWGQTQSPLTFDAPSVNQLKTSLAVRTEKNPDDETALTQEEAVLLTHWTFRASTRR